MAPWGQLSEHCLATTSQDDYEAKGSLQIKKMSQKVEKVHNFLDPPPGCFGLFFNLGKIGNLMTPPST